jgi:hypothetical protein
MRAAGLLVATLLAALGCSRPVANLMDAGFDDSGVDGGDGGVDAGIDCTQHCVIADSGTFCANYRQSGNHSCSVCIPQENPTDWTLLPLDAGCSTGGPFEGRGYCYVAPGESFEFCTCTPSTGQCNKDQDCCQGVCGPTTTPGLAGQCWSVTGDICEVGYGYTCLSGVCCADPTVDAGQYYNGRCNANDGGCP